MKREEYTYPLSPEHADFLKRLTGAALCDINLGGVGAKNHRDLPRKRLVRVDLRENQRRQRELLSEVCG